MGEKSATPGERTVERGSKLNRVDPLHDSRWNELISRHPKASVFHTTAWLESLRRTYGYKPIVYTTSAPDSALQDGIALCEIKSWLTGRRLVSLPFSDHCNPLLDSSSALAPFLSELQQQTQADGWRYIEIRPLGSTVRAASPYQSTDKHFFHQLDLSPDLNGIFRNCHKDSVQRKIRRAEREGLTHRDGPNEEMLKLFYPLFLSTRRRHQVPPQPVQWFRNLISEFGEALKIRVAFQRDEPVASILTLQFKDTLTYKYGCSNVHLNNLGGTQMLFWKAIQDAKGSGMRYFDLGRSDVDNSGLAIFKDRWGARRSEIAYLRCSTGGSSSAQFVSAENDRRLRLAKKVFKHVPDSVFSLMGRLLYKHIG